jgi:hypothetical protein
MTHVLNFNVFKKAIQKRFAEMTANNAALFRVSIPKDETGAKSDLLWNTYLGAFPEGTNPMYRERTEHDCTCCRHFIRDVGDVVTINADGSLTSIWDIDIAAKEPAYQTVANALSATVKAHAIGDVFLHYLDKAGTDRSFEQLVNGGQQAWDHFFVNIPRAYVVGKDHVATKLSEDRSARDSLHRSLTDLSIENIDAVLELITQGSIYRGDQFKGAVTSFRELKAAFDKLSADRQALFAWTKFKAAGALCGFRTSVIGTLVEDLAMKELDDAVKIYESKTAPQNYKRPTALVTKGMIEKAKGELQKLGLVSALERRFAVLTDITVNNVLFANRDAKATMTGDVFDDLVGDAKVSTRSFDKIEEVGIEKFLKDILPTAKSIELLLENKHTNRLVSLIAPTDPTAGKLFAWDNSFSWSYTGDVTDSIKERVKSAGGQVVGELCCRLAWDYTDDLDFHMVEPGGSEIYYGSYRLKGGRSLSPCGGELDLDANGVDGMKNEPCENIYYANRNRMKEGVYELFINNFVKRSTDGKGFGVDIEFDGVTTTIYYDRAIPSRSNLTVAKIKYSKKDGFTIIESLPSTSTTKDVWGLKTQTFQQVNVVMLSPNHWDDQKGAGNKHYFFMLQGCANDGTARGFYNEFLTPELNKHRKVLEMVGSKLKVAKASEQLSGLGFSSTVRDTVVVRVKGALNRVIRVAF